MESIGKNTTVHAIAGKQNIEVRFPIPPHRWDCFHVAHKSVYHYRSFPVISPRQLWPSAFSSPCNLISLWPLATIAQTKSYLRISISSIYQTSLLARLEPRAQKLTTLSMVFTVFSIFLKTYLSTFNRTPPTHMCLNSFLSPLFHYDDILDEQLKEKHVCNKCHKSIFFVGWNDSMRK